MNGSMLVVMLHFIVQDPSGIIVFDKLRSLSSRDFRKRVICSSECIELKISCVKYLVCRVRVSERLACGSLMEKFASGLKIERSSWMSGSVVVSLSESFMFEESEAYLRLTLWERAFFFKAESERGDEAVMEIVI